MSGKQVVLAWCAIVAAVAAAEPKPLSLIHDLKLNVGTDPEKPVCWVEENGERLLCYKGGEYNKEGRLDWSGLVDLERFRGMEVEVVFEYRAENLKYRPNRWAAERDEDFTPLTWYWKDSPDAEAKWMRPVIPAPKAGESTGWTTWRGRAVVTREADFSYSGARLVAPFGEGRMLVRDYRIEAAKEPFMDGIVRKAGAEIPEGYKCGYSAKWLDGKRHRGIVAMWNFKPDDFEKIAGWGCNLVRMSRFKPLSDDYRRLEANLAVLKKRGIRVVFAPMTPGYGGNMEKGDIFTKPDKREEYLKGWAKLAEYFRGRDDVWAFGLMNEPFQGLFGNDVDKFNFWQLQYEAIKTIRAIDPDRPIVASADGPGAPGDYELPYMRPFPFKDVWYELHVYSPLAFTHSDVMGTGLDFSKPENRYPGIKAGGRIWNKDTLASVFGEASAFAEKWGARWFLGEFSAARHAAGAAQWLDDVASVADSFPNLDMWTYHSYGEYHAWNLEYDETSPFDQAKKTPDGVDSERLKVMKRHWAANSAGGSACTAQAVGADCDDDDSPWDDDEGDDDGSAKDAARAALDAMKARQAAEGK